jgi:hypothetical protein
MALAGRAGVQWTATGLGDGAWSTGASRHRGIESQMKRSRVPSTQWRERPATTKPCARCMACDWQRLAVLGSCGSNGCLCLCHRLFWDAPSPDRTEMPKFSSVAQPRMLHQASTVEGRCRVERGQDVLLNRKESVCHVHPLPSTPRIPRLGLLSAAASLQIFQASASDRLHAGGFLFLQGSSLEFKLGVGNRPLSELSFCMARAPSQGARSFPKQPRDPTGPAGVPRQCTESDRQQLPSQLELHLDLNQAQRYLSFPVLRRRTPRVTAVSHSSAPPGCLALPTECQGFFPGLS